jgi:hypothetical protein
MRHNDSMRPLDDQKFDINAVYDFLSSKTLQRKVVVGGSISIYGKTLYSTSKIKEILIFCDQCIAINSF